jgi:ribonuclease HI
MNEIVLYFDGCSKGNPGPSGSGAIIKHQNQELWSGCEYVGNTTNNVAEYKGLILGLKYLTLYTYKHLKIKGDSMLVINQMTGKYKVKSPHLLVLYNEAKELCKDMNIEFIYIPREKNKEADELANKGLNQAMMSSNFLSHHS